MSDDQLLKKFESILAENNTVLLSAVDKKIIASEKRIKKDLTGQIEHVSKDLTGQIEHVSKDLTEKTKQLAKDLRQKIDESQEDTISVLSAVINTGYELHEERLQQVEKELELPPIKHSH